MKCVACGQPMVVLEIDRIEIDYCLDCGGTWLDAGELGLLLENREKVKRVLAEAADRGKKAGRGLKCPICRKRMDEIQISQKPPVAVDRCPDGDGLWFDRGELNGVTEVLGGVGDVRVADFLRDIFGMKTDKNRK